jgi:SOS-response transcriptional repressor LexA
MIRLTPKQERIWRYLKSCERSPTYREMCDALGYRSVGKLNETIVDMRERGYVAYIPAKARTLVALNPEIGLADYSTKALEAELERRLAA